eukprot:scaffold2724_cov260-Pinguiococcus_pyrenoidosus.AAC.27
MVAAVPYVRNDQGAQNHKQRLEQCICNVVQAYVSSMIESPRQTLAPNTTLDDPLEDAVLIREQMERLPVLVRFQYGNLGAFLLNTFEPIFNSYRSGVDALDAAQKDGAVTEQMTDEITLLEHQLTWLVHIYAAVVGAFQWSEASRDGEETMDARLNRQVLQLAAGIDFRVVNTNGAGKADPKLELALIGFLENFRRVYIWENHTLYALGSLQGESRVAHKMVEPTQKQQIFRSVFEAMQMGSHAEVVELLVRKLAGNLKYWGGESDIIHRSLSLLSDMASGFSSSKLLINLEVVKYMIANHGGEAFPFLLHPNHTRDRTVFHLALARLFLGTLEDPRPTFEAFMEPLLNLLAQLNGTADLRTEDARMAIIGVCRDLRGVAAATHNKKTYHLLFEALYPIHFPIFRRAVETWHDDPKQGPAAHVRQHERRRDPALQRNELDSLRVRQCCGGCGKQLGVGGKRRDDQLWAGPVSREVQANLHHTKRSDECPRWQLRQLRGLRAVPRQGLGKCHGDGADADALVASGRGLCVPEAMPGFLPVLRDCLQESPGDPDGAGSPVLHEGLRGAERGPAEQRHPDIFTGSGSNRSSSDVLLRRAGTRQAPSARVYGAHASVAEHLVGADVDALQPSAVRSTCESLVDHKADPEPPSGRPGDLRELQDASRVHTSVAGDEDASSRGADEAHRERAGQPHGRESRSLHPEPRRLPRRRPRVHRALRRPFCAACGYRLLAR